MSELTGSFITIDESNKNTSKSSIQQLVDIVQADVASTSGTTRKSYEVFTSGGVGLNPITSSLYQTVYDQDFTLGTSNPLFDISMGSYEEVVNDSDGNFSSVSVNGISATYDAGGKLTGFGNDTAMMREKVNIYKQFAQNLLGDASAAFVSPHGETPPATPSETPAKDAKNIKAAIFICFRRLFTRDNIFKGSFGVKVHKKASLLYQDFVDATRVYGASQSNLTTQADVNATDNNTAVVYDDRISTTNMSVSPIAGEVSTILDSSSNPIGLIYYDSGIIILDAERALDPDQIIRGLIPSTRQNPEANPEVATGPFYVYGNDSSNGEGYYYPLYTASTGTHTTEIAALSMIAPDGSAIADKAWYYDSSVDADPTVLLGSNVKPTNIPLWVSTNDDYYSSVSQFNAGNGKSLLNGKLYPNLWVSGTIDTVLDHVCTTRFGRGNLSAISFRNETIINSSLIFCRAAPSQLNYSTNPTYKDSDGNIIALNSTSEPFSFVTTVGLYDADRFLLAVAKTSRPIEKNPETDLSIRIRLDY
tara:strand:+ start:668 stop:2266 length:1599 start_codon:yes stop_codon:yes gene_type:complete